MTPEEIPHELIEMLNRDAGKEHNRNGRAVRSLAAILTRYEQIRNPCMQPGFEFLEEWGAWSECLACGRLRLGQDQT
jgi:hypothetical protein